MEIANVVIVGKVVKAPEVKQFDTGQLAIFTIAVNLGYGDKKKGHFFDCKCFGKLVDVAAKFFEKGKEVGVTGQLQQETWKDNATGGNRSKLVVVVSEISLGGRKETSCHENPNDDHCGGRVPF